MNNISDEHLLCRIESAKFRNPPKIKYNDYSIECRGIFPSRNFEVLFYRDTDSSGNKVKISPWDDIPLYIEKQNQVNFVCEVPKYVRSKLELCHESHSIKHNILQNGNLRFFRYGDNLFNYGFLPQTWEDPNIKFEGTEYYGDDDPLDAFEISDRQCYIGDIVKVKVLGGFYLIDQKETDWKILTMDIDHPKANLIHDIDDIKREMPGIINAIREWLRVYKVYEGKELNEFYSEKPFNRETAMRIISDTHQMWKHKINKN
jgi:inorganic pyrophosphatase